MQGPAGAKKKVIDGVTYEIMMLAPDQALEIAVKHMKLIGTFIGKAAGAVKPGAFSKTIDEAIDMGAAGMAITALTERLNEQDVKDIVNTMLTVVNIQTDNGGFVPVKKDIHFSGKIFHMLKVVGAALEVNFGDFFAGLSGLKTFAQQAISMIQAKSISTPGSGESGSAEKQA